jgi:tetratricopeptide (TPR) repeat protein
VSKIEKKKLIVRLGFARRSVALHFLVIAVLGLFIYSNNLDVPFLWDDTSFIGKNPVVRDLAYFTEPSDAMDTGYYKPLVGRYIGYLSFALNYRIHGYSVTGYHLFNNITHITSACLLYLLVLFSFRTPLLRTSSLKEKADYIALFSGLMFVAHPVQTEAVTYIFQRFASLAAMFFLLSVVLYAGWMLAEIKSENQESTGGIKKNKKINKIFYILSLLSALLAMKTKENTFTLPLVIMLYDFIFFRAGLKTRALRIAPFVVVLFVALLTLIGINGAPMEVVGQAGALSRGFEDISRSDYFFTQFRVIVTYIRLLFLPVGQNLDYDYPLYRSLFEPEVVMSFLFLLSVLSLGVYFIRQSRHADSAVRLAAFGIFWFFATLLVESGIIPLAMLIDEYRVYLPSVGAFAAMAVGLFWLLEELAKNKRLQTAVVAFMIVLPLVLSGAAYARNGVYKNKVTLWEDVTMKSPGKARAHYNLGVAYSEGGFESKAIYHYHIALTLNPKCADTNFNIGRLYYRMGLIDHAIGYYKNALNVKPDADAHNNIAVAYATKGLIEKCIEHCKLAVELRPDFDDAHFNLGLGYHKKGLVYEALKSFENAIKIKPDHDEARRFIEHIRNVDLQADAVELQG